MKKWLILVVTVILSITSMHSVYAKDADKAVTFSLNRPAEWTYKGEIYVLYSGTDTDIFAELNEENEYTANVSVPSGTYDIFQIVTTNDTNYEFLCEKRITVEGDLVVPVFIEENGNIINADGEVPTNLAAYGELIAKEIKYEEDKLAQELMEEQEAEFVRRPVVPAKEKEEKSQIGGRETKVKSVTGTKDAPAASSIAPIIIVVATILGVGILIVIVVLLKKVKNGGNKNGNDRREEIKN